MTNPRAVRAYVLAVAVVSMGACSGNPLNPEAGLHRPKDPGTVLTRVTDPLGTPVPNVEITVSEIPNSVGSFYSVSQFTRADGTTSIGSIDAGSRKVTMTVPPGFNADPEGSSRQVAVVKDATVTVSFRISKQ